MLFSTQQIELQEGATARAWRSLNMEHLERGWSFTSIKQKGYSPAGPATALAPCVGF